MLRNEFCFEERQTCSRAYILANGIPIALGVLLFAFELVASSDTGRCIGGLLFCLLLAVFAYGAGTVRTRVLADSVRVDYAFNIPVVRKRQIQIRDIKEHRCSSWTPFWTAWGFPFVVRFGYVDQLPARLLASFDLRAGFSLRMPNPKLTVPGVLIETHHGERFFIGSQQAELLNAAIDRIRLRSNN